MDTFAALADPTRRKIVELLAARGQLSASEISERFAISPPAISQHLKILREANLVRVEKRAQQRIYRINPETMLELEDWARRMSQLWNQRFDALDRLLEEEKRKASSDLAKRSSSMNTQEIKEVTITRTFDAPREMVFKAFTDPALVKQWWSPHHFTNPYAEMDARPGGSFEIHMQGPDGTIYPDKGTFEEVVPPERLVFLDGAMEDEQGVPMLQVHHTITFEEVDGKTLLTLHAVVIRAAPEVAGALAGMEQGWSESFEKLAALLERK
jgi:uncharacterized protein YndB with AHSA1/START domain/DNA-binding transcriptional ArsR family regulator